MPGAKKRRMMDVMQAIQKTPPPSSTEKTVVPADAEAEANEFAPEVENLGTTMSEINRLISDVAPEKDIAKVSTDKALALKVKELKKASSEDTELDLRHLGGQALSDEDIFELKEFALAADTSPDPCSSAVWTKRFWGVFLIAAEQRLLILYKRLLGFRCLSGTSVTIGKNTLLGAYSTRIIRYKLLCPPL
jgi:hypothetical protein